LIYFWNYKGDAMYTQIKSHGKNELKTYYIWHNDSIYKDMFFDSWVDAAIYAEQKENLDTGDLGLIARCDGIALVINNSDDSEREMTYAELRQLDIVELAKTHTIITEI
jgi:hypothetical protein